MEQLIVTVCSSFDLIQITEVKRLVSPGKTTVQQRQRHTLPPHPKFPGRIKCL